MKQSNINFKAKFFTLFIYLTYHARIVSLGSHHWVPRVLYFLYLSKVFLWLKTFFCIFDGVFFLRGSALKPMMILLRLFNVVKILVTSRGSFSLSFHRKLDRVQIFSCLQKYFSNFSKKKIFFQKNYDFFVGDFLDLRGWAVILFAVEEKHRKLFEYWIGDPVAPPPSPYHFWPRRGHFWCSLPNPNSTTPSNHQKPPQSLSLPKNLGSERSRL